MAQKVQPIAQPTCEEMHAVRLPTSPVYLPCISRASPTTCEEMHAVRRLSEYGMSTWSGLGSGLGLGLGMWIG